ncbi:acyl carrier protein [Rhodopila sp.]|uniref:acyl carrier protein n=1 Tax=Rhodopila sp. TaxID=2480087 RepID=UPI003D0EB7BD
MAAHLAELTDIVRGVLRNADVELVADSRFQDLPAWDSMDLVAVVVEAECRFGLLFEPEEIEALHTAADLLQAIVDKRALGSA